MKYKKILLLLFVFLLVFLCYYFQKENFQSYQGKDILIVIEKFCNQHFGDNWNIDSLVSYNEKITFVVIQTKNKKIDLSIQPDSRAIIIENIRGDQLKTNQRIFRY